ncbi:glycoside hydrolase [Streptomyces kanasensis]|uniref:hypothetical protein n=1 Tax=Streptomyces kanasensis TaxID=936756 RepID=UPI00382F5BE5
MRSRTAGGPADGGPPPRRPRRRSPRRRLVASLTARVAAATSVLTGPGPARPANERVDVRLATTSDAAGRSVTRGLAPRTPRRLPSRRRLREPHGRRGESTTYQRFEGGGASITGTTSHLLRGGAVSPATRGTVMRRVPSPTEGIGLSFVRNPIGASDLARPGHASLDDTCRDPSGFGTNGYDTGVRLLTAHAKRLDPAPRDKGVRWSAPGGVKDNGRTDRIRTSPPPGP